MNTAKPAYPYQFSSPYFRRLGYGVWLVLLLFSIVFYKERVIFLDGAFQLYKLITQGEFKIFHYRLTNPLTQVLALGAIHLKLPLKWIMLAYSVNFILLFGFIYHAIVSWCKNDYLGWVLIFFFTLIVLDSFYFLPPELYQGAAFLLLWFAILLRDPLLRRWWTFPLLLLLIIPIVSDTRLTPIYFLFTAAFFWLNNPKQWNKQFYILIAFFFLCIFIHSQYFVAPYDANKMLDFQKNLEAHRSDLLGIPAHQKFLSKCFKIYYCYPILLFLVVANYVWAVISKSTTIRFPLLKLLGVLFANLFFILVLHIGSPNTSYRFYAEVNYLPLMILTGIPFIFDFAANIKKERWLLTAFALLMAIRLNTIGNNHQRFTDRHQWYQNQMQIAAEQGTNRSLLYFHKTPRHTLIQTWASPYETLLLSSLDGPKNAATHFIYDDFGSYQKVKDSTNYFLSNFEITPVSEMNHTYFRLGENLYINTLKTD